MYSVSAARRMRFADLHLSTRYFIISLKPGVEVDRVLSAELPQCCCFPSLCLAFACFLYMSDSLNEIKSVLGYIWKNLCEGSGVMSDFSTEPLPEEEEFRFLLIYLYIYPYD